MQMIRILSFSKIVTYQQDQMWFSNEEISFEILKRSLAFIKNNNISLTEKNDVIQLVPGDIVWSYRIDFRVRKTSNVFLSIGKNY
jgi:hypothetical protein